MSLLPFPLTSNREETDSPPLMRLIASPSRPATLSTVSLKPGTGWTTVLLVVMSSSMSESWRRLMAIGVSSACETAARIALGALFLQQLGRGGQRAGGFGQVIDHEDILALDFADEILRLDRRRTGPLLGDDGQAGVEQLGIGRRHLHSADIRRNDDQVFQFQRGEVTVDDRRGVKVVDRNIEKTLDLLGVQIHAKDPVRAAGGEQDWRRAWP